MRRSLPWSFSLLLLVAGCDPGTVTPRGDGGELPDGGRGPLSDADGDGIADVDEGAALNRDTDGDGTPDYLDDDSDGDGLPDRVEAGDDNLQTPPVDSDGDSIPDFIDLDSDDNGIPDARELDGDVDGDGIANYADLDDDNDLIADDAELAGMFAPPLDTDGDGLPDYQDRDSDNDNIMDGHERDVDTDGDGIFDVHDLDSDDDGLSDAEEAGDTDLDTPPIDTDMDTIPDFRDLDSDADGLTDGDEVRIHGTSPTSGDTDGDGVSDLIEVSAGTDPLDGMDSPRTRGDFVFEVPYMEPPTPDRDTLTFSTSIQFADVYFLFDISGSMGGEISALRSAVGMVIGDLTCVDTGTACMGDEECSAGNVCSPFSNTCIEDPSMSSCVASPWTGAGYYETSYWHTGGSVGPGIRLQSDPAMTSSTMAGWSTFGGTERLYQAIEGVANRSSAVGCEPMMAGFVGCPNFREEAVKILVVFTDEDSDGGSLTAAGAALMSAGITMIGVNSGGARSALVSIANESGSVDRTGAPLVYDGSDAGVVPAVVTAINEIVQGVPLRVTIEATDEPGDAGDSLQFILSLETNTTGTGCSMIATEDSDGDGTHETFPAVTPGTPVCWDVVPRQNDTVMPTAMPQVFKAKLTVYGDGSPLDSRFVYFLVPPEIPDIPGGPD